MRPGDSVMIIQSKRAPASSPHLGQLGLVIEEFDHPDAGWNDTGDWYTVLVGGDFHRFRDDYLELT